MSSETQKLFNAVTEQRNVKCMIEGFTQNSDESNTQFVIQNEHLQNQFEMSKSAARYQTIDGIKSNQTTKPVSAVGHRPRLSNRQFSEANNRATAENSKSVNNFGYDKIYSIHKPPPKFIKQYSREESIRFNTMTTFGALSPVSLRNGFTQMFFDQRQKNN